MYTYTEGNFNVWFVGRIGSFGTDNGLTLILDASFGRDTFLNENSAFRLYIHEHGSLPDYHNQEIELQLGLKYNITFQATKFTVTEALKTSPVKTCQPNVQKSTSSHDLFDKYSLTNCVMEKSIDMISEGCQCLPIEIMDYMFHKNNDSIQNQKVLSNASNIFLFQVWLSLQVCINLDRMCAMKILQDVKLSNQLSDSCLNACDEIQYSVTSQASTKLSDV